MAQLPRVAEQGLDRAFGLYSAFGRRRCRLPLPTGETEAVAASSVSAAAPAKVGPVAHVHCLKEMGGGKQRPQARSRGGRFLTHEANMFMMSIPDALSGGKQCLQAAW